MAFAIASGLTPQAGILLRCGHWLSHLGAGWIDDPDRRSHRSLCGRNRRHRRRSWRRRPVHVHSDGRSDSRHHGPLPGWATAVKYIPRPIVIGFTKRHSHPDRQHAGKRFLRPSTWRKFRAVFWARIEALAQNFHTFSVEATVLAAGTIVVIVGLPRAFQAGSPARLSLWC